jgi:hypothetical protein
MPRKIFVAGEILTAADLQANAVDQSVMVFDDSAARGSAIPSPSEGMVTYLKDTDNVEQYNGAAFVPVGGLVATKSVLKTDIFSASVTAGNNVEVTDLSITHTMQNANNKLLIHAYFGVAATSGGRGQTGMIVADGSTLIAIGDAASSRTRNTAGAWSAGSSSTLVGNVLSATFVYLPGDTASHDYNLRAVNVDSNTRTIYINRTDGDSNNQSNARSTSGLVIQEVAV